MHQQKSKKILIYFFLFLTIGSINNKNFNIFDIPKINIVEINGLDQKNNFQLSKNLDHIKSSDIFFIDEKEIIEIINSNKLIEKYSVFKKYPSTLKIDVNRTEFLANIKKEKKNFLLGSNGKLIESKSVDKNLPFIYGKLDNDAFFYLRKLVNESNFEFNEIKNLFYFKSGRWDIETHSGLKIKLPKNDLKKTFDLLANILNKFGSEKIISIDLRQKNHVIIDEQ